MPDPSSPPRGWIRQAGVVLWGGRPDFDYQFGSPLELSRARRLYQKARTHAAMRAIGKALAPTIEDASRAIRRFADAVAARTNA